MLGFTGKVLFGLSLGMASSFILGASSVGLWTLTWPIIVLTGAVGGILFLIGKGLEPTKSKPVDHRENTDSRSSPPPYQPQQGGATPIPVAQPVQPESDYFFQKAEQPVRRFVPSFHSTSVLPPVIVTLPNSTPTCRTQAITPSTSVPLSRTVITPGSAHQVQHLGTTQQVRLTPGANPAVINHVVRNSHRI